MNLYQAEADIKKINATLTGFERVIGKLIATDTTFEHYFAAIYSTLLLEEQSERNALAETAIDRYEVYSSKYMVNLVHYCVNLTVQDIN